MRRVASASILVVVSLLLAQASLGQVPDPVIAAQAPVPGAGHHYIGMGAETVNPADGSLSFDLPFDPPAGRGPSVKFGIRFAGTEQFYLSNKTTQNGTLVWTPNWQFGQSPFQVGAWSYDLPILTATDSILWAGVTAVCPNGQCTLYPNRCWGSDSFVFRGLDGNQVSLPIADVHPDPNNYQTSFCPTPANFKGVGNNHGILSTLGSTSTTVVDQSGTTYQFGFVYANNSEPSAPFYDPGTGGWLASSITDRNGNQITLSGNSYKDATGRTALSWTGIGNNGDQISIAGLGGPVTVKWTTTPVSYPESGYNNAGSGYPCSLGGGTVSNVSVISEIDLPNIQSNPNQKYTFQYDGTYGMVSKITFPDGGYVSYHWGLNSSAQAINATWWTPEVPPAAVIDTGTPPQQAICTFIFDVPAITDRYVSFDGVNVALHQQFSYSTSWNGDLWTNKQTTVTTTDQLTGQVTKTAYSYGSATADSPVYAAQPYSTQIPIETNVLYKDGNGKIYKEVNQTWASPHLMLSDQTILYDSSGNRNVGNATVRCYDANEQIANVYEFGFQTEGAFPGNQGCIGIVNTTYVGPLRRQTTTAYHPFFSWNGSTNPATYTGTHIVNAPDAITVADGSGNTAKQTNFTYTNTVQSSNPATAVGLVSPPGPDRANIASISRLISTGIWATTSYGYFNTGQLQSMTDACGNATCGDVTGSSHTTTYSYTDNFAAGTGTPPGQTNAYLTSVTFPNTGVSHTQSFTWGYTDGQIRSSTDQNGQTTNFLFNDPGLLGRLTEVDYPDFSSGDKTTVTYNDSLYNAGNNTPNFTTSRAITSSLNLVNTTAFDGMGHTVRTLLTSDPDGPTMADSALDGLGRARTKTNPYRSASSTTDGTTTYNYDALGRIWNIGEPDGSAQNFQFNGNCKTIWDEASKVRGECYDSLGRLTQVWEDQPGYNYPTFYYYDVLGNLTCVEQTGNVAGTGCSSPPSSDATSPWRVRRFTYDSLSRLLTASNPESGTITYTYDANGNVSTKKAPSPNETNSGTQVTTSYFYDALNRLVTKSYTDAYTSNPPTTMVTYGYDGIAATSCTPPSLSDSYPKGHRTSMCDGSGSASWSHDRLGRTTTESRKVNGFTRNISYGYNLDGSLASITYPSGRVVSYTPGGAGRPTAVADSTGPINYVQGVHYAPFGGLTDMTQGATPITIKNRYSPRLQPVLLSAYTSAATIMSLCYDFHSAVALSSSSFGPCSFSASPAGDNGNVYQIVNNRDSNRTQNFMYDSLNRIQQAYSSGPNWGETYSSTATAPGVAPPTSGIDAWGNLTNHVGVTGKTNTEGTFGCPASTNNQLTTCGLTHDAAGNAYINNGVTYTYDAENRLVTPGAGNGTYLYDGDGNRMARLFSSSGTEYWRDLSGNTLLEDSNTGVNLREYIYFAGKKIARRDVVTNNVHYVFSDHLGSTSLMTDALGTMATCNGHVSGQFESDYYPYGGEMSLCNNLGDQNYKFTGKERDAETGLDNFGKRYNSSSLGRFMTPDPMLNSGYPANPQTWNRYSYALNNPVTFTDPLGLYVWGDCRRDAEKCKAEQQRFRDSIANLKKAAQGLKEGSKERKKIEAVIGKLGEEGKGNVTVNFGDLGQDKQGNLILGETKGNNMTVDYGNVDKIKSGYNLNTSEASALDAGVTGHEGTHAGSWPSVLGFLDMSYEHKAYWNESVVYQGLHNTDRTNNHLWNESWATIDQQLLDKTREQAVQHAIHPDKVPVPVPVEKEQ